MAAGADLTEAWRSEELPIVTGHDTEFFKGEDFLSHPDRRLLIFTEFRDTLDYLVAKLRQWGFSVESIHGSMKPGSRDEPGTRLYAEQKFRDGPLQGGVQVLVATEAAGEGISRLRAAKCSRGPYRAPKQLAPPAANPSIPSGCERNLRSSMAVPMLVSTPKANAWAAQRSWRSS